MTWKAVFQNIPDGDKEKDLPLLALIKRRRIGYFGIQTEINIIIRFKHFS
jgi:hypothetical protein